MKSIDEHLKSCSPYDVYTYSFNKAEVEHINRALQRYELVQEIKKLIYGDVIKDLIQKIKALPYDYEKNYMNRRYVIMSDVIEVLESEVEE